MHLKQLWYISIAHRIICVQASCTRWETSLIKVKNITRKMLYRSIHYARRREVDERYKKMQCNWSSQIKTLKWCLCWEVPSWASSKLCTIIYKVCVLRSLSGWVLLFLIVASFVSITCETSIDAVLCECVGLCVRNPDLWVQFFENGHKYD